MRAYKILLASCRLCQRGIAPHTARQLPGLTSADARADRGGSAASFSPEASLPCAVIAGMQSSAQ